MAAAFGHAMALAGPLVWATLTLQGCFKQLGLETPSWTGGSSKYRSGSKCSPVGSHGRRMDCGAGVEVCGVLTLETGEGPGAYQNPEPVVHGLWPETDTYGTSECEKPQQSSADPKKIYPCYDTQGSESSAAWFQRHEWEKHGICAGVKNADDFFRQVCQLSSGPLQVMAGARAAGLDLVDMADQLQRAGICVFHIDTYNSQLYLSACQDEKSGLWHLADVTSFPEVCGDGGGGSGGQCVTGQRGPRCSTDADCWDKDNCLRCAHSGYCTDVPLSRSLSEHFTSLWGFSFQEGGHASTAFVAINVLIASVYLLISLIIVYWNRPRAGQAASSPLIQADPEE